MRHGFELQLLFFLVWFSGCRAATPGLDEAEPGEPARLAIERTLDDWHRAASQADGPGYFGRMADGAIFLGTDATERWTRDQFRDYCEPYFSAGRGWTYEPRERHVFVSGTTAWFDERLWNDKYGECRGTGVLAERAGEWKLVHYSLTLPIPNELASQVVTLIRER